MRAIKSILRGIIGLQAATMLMVGAVGLLGVAKLHNHVTTSPIPAAHAPSASLSALAIAAAFIALGAVFAIAWWTTRKSAATFGPWAIAASLLNIAQGIFLAWFSHLAAASRIHYSPANGLWFIVLGLAGLYLFSRREVSSEVATVATKAVSVAGDRTSIVARHAVTALSTVTQIAALIFWSRWAFTQHLLRRHGLAWIVLITAASILTTLIHECGHAVLAWCFEMKLLSFKAGPFQWTSREGNWAFRFNAAGLLAPGGCIAATPTRPDQAAWEFILMIAAGPGANLLFGSAAIWAVLHDRWDTYQQTWEFLAYTGAFCLIGAALNLIPFLSEEGSYSDGARILQIVTRSPLAAAAPAESPAQAIVAIPENAPPPLAVVPPPPFAPALAVSASATPRSPVDDPSPMAETLSRLVLQPDPEPPAPIIPKPVETRIVAAPQPVAPKPPVAPAAAVLTAAAISQRSAPEPIQPPVVVTSAASVPEPVISQAPAAPITSPPARIPEKVAAKENTPVPAKSAAKEKTAAPGMAAPNLDELLAARLQDFFARPTPPPPSKDSEPKPVVRTPASPPIPEPAASTKQDSVPLATAEPNPAAAETLADHLATISPENTSSASAVAQTSVAIESTAPVEPLAQKTAPKIVPEVMPLAAQAAEKPADSFARIFSAQTSPEIPSTPIAVPPALIATSPELSTTPPTKASDPLAPSSPSSTPASGGTGLIASSTRIPASALSTAVKPPQIRLASAPVAPSTPAPGSKAPAVPPAFARRARPAPLTSPLLGIEEIIAAASIPADDPASALPAEAAIVETPAEAEMAPPASISESVPVGPVFSEAWPPRPTSTQTALDRKEMLAAIPAASEIDPPPVLIGPIEDQAAVDKPFPPQPEKPRYDPMEFIRAAALEAINANAS